MEILQNIYLNMSTPCVLKLECSQGAYLKYRFLICSPKIYDLVALQRAQDESAFLNTHPRSLGGRIADYTWETVSGYELVDANIHKYI